MVAFVALNLPFFVWDAADVVAAYTTQSTRGIIAESLPFLPLRLLGLAEVSPSGHIWEEAVVPAWADGAALAAQVVLLAVVVAVAVRAPRRPRRGRRLRSPCPRRLPAHEPGLQPAVRARGACRLGGRGRAARAVGA